MNNPWDVKLDPANPKRHLHTLHTPLGQRMVYDSIAFCNRCGCCSQSCWTYRFTQEEALSARGRNQLARLITEGKLAYKDNPRLIENAVSSCSFCGSCTAACAGKIPTAEHMLELRRALNLKLLPTLLQQLLTWRETSSKRFARVVRTGIFLRNLGSAKILRFTQLTRLPFLKWMNHADDILPHRITPLSALLKKEKYTPPQIPDVIYLPSLEAEFLNPQIGLDSLKTLKGTQILVWQNTSAGLFSYVYGDLRQARKSARKLLSAYGKIQNGMLPLVTDSGEVYTFLKKYEQLFSNNTFWKARAEALSKNVRYISEYFPKKPSNVQQSGRVKLDASNLFDSEGELFVQAQQILRTLFNKNFVQYSYNEPAAPPLAYGFVKPQYAQQAFFAKGQDTARTQTGTVFILSGLCALELDFYFKKHYPYARAQHFARLNG